MKKIALFLTIMVCIFALVSISLAELILPESVEIIDSEAFANCEDAQILTIYNSNATIADSALDGSGVKTIRCYRDATQIIEFADRHNIDIEYLDSLSVTIWVSGNIKNLTARQVEAFKAANPQYANADVTVIEASESEAVSDLRNASEQPDIFGFAQDQLIVLKSMGKLDPVINASAIRNRNAAGSVAAAEIGGTLYGYPMTADNGYFLFYDKSVITDPSSLESIITDCENAGKNFGMQVDSGWYQIAFFFGAGCNMEFHVSDAGEFDDVDISYANENGLKAMKSLIKTIGSTAFVNSSEVGSAGDWAAIVSGTWSANDAKTYLGTNFAAAKLPTIDGYQMKSYGGFKILGVTPQEDDGKRELCHALADWLTNESCQLDRFDENGWGPSNLAAQQSEAIQGNLALTALAEQAAYAVPQGQIHGGYWSLAEDLINEIMMGELADASDADIMDRLVEFEHDIQDLLGTKNVNLIGISMPTSDFQRWANDGANMKAYIEEAGFTAILQYADNNVEKQKNDINEMIDEGVSILIIAPISPYSLGTEMARASGKGIPVISYDRLIMGSDAVSYYTTFDNYLVGAVQGRYIRDQLRLDSAVSPFNLEITTGDPGDNNAHYFYQGAIDVLAPYIDSGKLLVKSGQVAFEDVATSGWSTYNAKQRAEEILSTYYVNDTIHAWLCSNDSTALGITQALEGRYGDAWPVITGQDCDISNVRNIIHGKQSMSVMKDTRIEAAQAAKMACQIGNGQAVDVNDWETYDNGEKVVPSFLCAPVYVDAENYRELLIDTGIYREEDLQ